jgi:oxaloacetate decarboxylase
VMRTVEELESAGVALVLVEDTVLPTQFGHKGNRLISIPEAVGKLRAALRARQDPGLVIAGRSQSARSVTIEELVERARAYEATGVDALWFSGITTRAQIEAIAAAVKVPILMSPLMEDGAPANTFDLDFLAAHRVRSCLQGHQPIKAAIRAVYETMKALRAGVSPAALPNLASEELMERVTRASDYEEWAREFLGGN